MLIFHLSKRRMMGKNRPHPFKEALGNHKNGTQKGERMWLMSHQQLRSYGERWRLVLIWQTGGDFMDLDKQLIKLWALKTVAWVKVQNFKNPGLEKFKILNLQDAYKN